MAQSPGGNTLGAGYGKLGIYSSANFPYFHRFLPALDPSGVVFRSFHSSHREQINVTSVGRQRLNDRKKHHTGCSFGFFSLQG